MLTEKVKTARLSILSNSCLIVLKVVAGFVSGSVSIISEAIHSGMDLLAAVIAFFSVKYSDTPPDAEHPYGHGKFENVSGVIEAVLIFIAAGWIIYKAIKKMINPAPVEKIEIGSMVMLISAVVNFFVSRKLYRVARKTDVLTSLGVAAGLILMRLSGWLILDPVIAILVAMIILRESYILLRSAFSPLLDASLSEQENAIIRAEITQRNFTFHNLRTRKSGHFRFADVHLEMPEDMALKDIHRICDEIENKIESQISGIEINIHVEPAEKEKLKQQ